MDHADDADLACHGCGAHLRAGDGSFYVVNIEAFADPSPPRLDESGQHDPASIDDLIESMKDMSERELLDQVHRRLRLILCARCYSSWIENPTG